MVTGAPPSGTTGAFGPPAGGGTGPVPPVGPIGLLTIRRTPADDPEAEAEPAPLWVVAVALVAVAVCVVRLVQTR